MNVFTAGELRLEYQVRGNGEPLLLIHGAIVGDAFEPIAEQLSAGYQLITYHRRGFAGSAPAAANPSIPGHAADAAALLDHLGVAKAHVAGHSYGGAVALQLALEAPERVHSLGLLEPGLLAAPSGADFGAGVAPIAETFQAGEHDAALVAFLTAVGGENPIPRLDKTLSPGWYQQAITDLPTLFGADLPSLGAWEFDEAQAGAISQPALVVVGTETFPLCAESHDLLKAWLPNGEVFVLPGATHMLHMDDPDGMADGLLAFLRRHPLAT